MAAACDFDAVPRSITSGGKVRFFPRVSGFTIPITSYQWKFGDQYTFTTDFATSTSQLLLADADDYFAVDERVMLSTSNTLPTGLSSTVLYFVKAVTATYLTVSLTSGGAAVTFSDNGVGTHKVEHGSALATPIFTYPTVIAATGYDVYLKVTDANSNTANKTNTDFIASNAVANVSAVPKDGTWYKVSVLLYDATNSIIVNRLPWTGSHLYLLNPKVVDSIDKIGVLSFSILDIDDSTATEESLIAEGVNVAFIRERQVLYSGVVKRVTQVTQNGYDTTTRVKVWDFECDNDLARLGKLKVESSVLPAEGATLYDTPGSLARLMLTPASGERDARGVINCIDAKVLYQLNSFTEGEDIGSRYEHLMNIHGLTNYDLRTRPNFLVFDYDTFDGANIVTINAGAFAVDEFLGGYMLFVSSTNLDTTVNASGVLSFGKITGNTATTITCSTLTGAAVAPTSNGQVIIFLGYYVDFAQDLSQPSVIAAYTLNNDILQYNDNDDKRKLSTKIVASGKNLQGITISVAVAGVHAYDNDTQFFEDATHITLKSEGYIYKNNYLISSKTATVFAHVLYKAFTTNYGSDIYKIGIASEISSFPINAGVYFTKVGGTLPTNIQESTGSILYWYYIVYNDGTNVKIATTHGGSAIDIGSNASGTVYINHDGGIQIDNTDGFINTYGYTEIFFMKASGLPGGIAATKPYYTKPSGYSSATAWFRLYPSSQLLEAERIDISSLGGSTFSITRDIYMGNISEMGWDPVIYLYGWEYSIPSGSTMALSIPFGIAVSRVTSGVTVESTDSNGVQYTKVILTVFPDSDFSGEGFLLNQRLYVDDASKVGNNEVLIGEEKITINSNGTDTTYGNYIQFADVTTRITSSTLKCYPHGVGALVARTNYTEAVPQTNSPIDSYGLYIDNRTVDGNITFGILDAYATNLLLGLGNFYKKATGWGSLENLFVKRVGEYYAGLQQVSLSTPVRIADRISTTEYTGATPEEIQVVETTLICDEGRMLLNLGDFERNVFTTMQAKTAAINRPLT